MLNRAQKKIDKDSRSLIKFKLENNRSVLMSIFVISLIIELVFLILVSFRFTEGLDINIFIDNSDFKYKIPFILISLLFLVCIYFLYEKFPAIIGFLSIFFILFQKPLFFLKNTQSIFVLVFWIVLSLLFGWFYYDVKIVISAILSSFFSFILGLFLAGISISGIHGFLWVIGIFTVISVAISLRKHTMQYNKFIKCNNLYNENEKNKKRLNYDSLTGFYNRESISEYIDDQLSSRNINGSYLVVIDLDSLKKCNDFFGLKTGDLYIKTFSKIIKFLLLNENDRIGRTGDNEFTAILTGYKYESTIESKLDRYNILFKKEFNSVHPNSKILPHFCYGIVKLHDRSTLSEVYHEADKTIQTQKDKIHEGMVLSDFYQSGINYTSLLNAGRVVTIVWLPKRGWPIGYITENIKNLLGYTSDEMINGNLVYEKMIHPDDIDRIMNETVYNLGERKKYYEQKYRVRRSDGEYIWIRDYSNPIWEEDRLIQTNGYMYDITEEMVTKELLTLNNQRLNNVIEASNVGIWEWNFKTKQIYCNKNLAAIMGFELYEIEAFTIQQWILALHPDDQDRFKLVVDEYNDGRRDIYNTECRIKHKDGHWNWIHGIGKITKRDEKGRPLNMIGSLIDIAQIKETEAMLYHSDKLSALGRLSGGISHDMNNQLMKIRGTAEIAKIWDSKEHYRSSLETIETLCDSASWIIQQLMVFSGNNTSNPEFCDLGKILWELSELLDHTFEKEILVNSDIPNESLYISADQTQLKKAFFNICYNSKEAMVHGGTLKISLKKTQIENGFVSYTGDLPAGNYLQVEFTDEGVGIDETVIDKIFEPFYTTKDFGAQGLGLAKVVTVVKELKGGIQVSSTKGRGSVFTVYIPHVESTIEIAQTHKDQLQFKVGVSKEILIIDDELMICELLSMYFGQMNWESKYFTNPLEGIEYFKDNKDKVGLVILDKFMPEINGDQVFKELISLRKDVRILFISGLAPGEERHGQHEENIAGFIKKPVKLNDLKKIVEDEFSS